MTFQNEFVIIQPITRFHENHAVPPFAYGLAGPIDHDAVCHGFIEGQGDDCVEWHALAWVQREFHGGVGLFEGDLAAVDEFFGDNDFLWQRARVRVSPFHSLANT